MTEETIRRSFSEAYITGAAHILSILSHETRLKIVLALAQGESNVSELCDYLNTPQSNVSHHLRILRDVGLVEDERDGQFVVYRLHLPTWRSFSNGFFDFLLGGSNEVKLQNLVIRREG